MTSFADATGGLTIVDAGGLATIGAVGSGASGDVTITNSQAGVTFSSTVDAGTLLITDTTGTVTVQGDLTAATLTTANQDYNVQFDEDVTITADASFLNTGTVALGSANDDVLVFNGGINTTGAGSNPSGTTLAGTLRTSGDQVDLGAVTLGADSVIDTTNNGGSASGAGLNIVSVDADDASGQDRTLTLNSGTGGTIAVSGAVGGTEALAGLDITNSNGATFSGAVTVSDGSGVLDISDTEDTMDVTFSGDVTAVTLTTTGNLYDVIFQEDVTVTNDVTFAAIRNLDIGGATDDTATFTGGLDTATNVTGTVTIAGTINTTNTQMDLGAVTLAADTTLDTGNAAAGVLNVGAVTSGTNALTLDSGSTAGATIGLTSFADATGGLTIVDAGGLATIGAVGSGASGDVTITNSQAGVTFSSTVDAGTLLITDTTGTVTVQGDLTAATLTTANQDYNVQFDEDVTITADASFLNTGTVALGSANDDVLVFNGGINTTGAGSNPSGTTLAGTLRTSGDQVDLGAVTLGADSVIDTTNNGGSASGAGLNIVSVDADDASGQDRTLTLNSGTGGTIAVSGAVGGTEALAGLDITNSNGATFSGAVTVSDGSGVLDISDTEDTMDVTFSGDVTAVTLTTTGNLYDVIFQEDVTVTNDVTFAAIRNLDIGGATDDTATFTGGLDTATNVTGTVTIAGTINTTNTQMDLGAVTLAADTTLDTGNAAAGVLNVGAVTSGTNALTLDSGSTAGATIGLTSFADATGGLTIRDAGGLATIGAVGSGASGDVTITNSQAGVTFSSTVDAGTLAITDTADNQDITFSGDVTAVTLTTTGNLYDVIFQEDVTVTNDVTFAAIRNLDIGGATDDTATFTGGLDTATNVTGTVTIAGTINTTNTQMDLGAVTLAADTTLDTGNAAAGVLNVGAVTSGTNALTLDSGSTAGATIGLTSFADATGGLTIVDAGGLATIGAVGSGASGDVTITNSQAGVTFSSTVDAGTLLITDTTGTVTVQGDLTAATLTTANQDYNVQFDEDVTITADASFLNTGTVALGSANDDVLVFNGGINTTGAGSNPSGTTLAGTLRTSGDQVDLGAVTLGADSVIDTTNNGGSASGAGLNIVSVDADDASGQDRTLTLNSGTGGTIAVSGAVGGTEALAGLDITNSNGATFSGAVTVSDGSGVLDISDTEDTMDVTFSGDVTAVTLTTTGNLYDVIFQEDVTVTNDVTFAAIRNLDIGGATDDTATFTGGLDTATNVTGTVTIAGTINTTNTQMDLGAVTLAADTTLDTGNAAAGVLNVGAVTSGTNALTLDSGSTAGATIGLTSFADATGGLTIVDAGGLATIGAVGSGASGDVTITNSQAGVTFSSTVDAGTLLITDTTGTVTVQGDLTAATLTTANQDYNVQFDEDVTITADASFLNTGTVALGSANDDVLVFNGGINTTGAGSNPSGTTLAGTLRTSGDQVDLGAVTLGADSVIDTTNNGGSASGAGLNIVSVDADDASGQDRTLTLNSGTGGTIAVSGAVGGTEALAGLDITNSNGATFSGAVTVSDGSGVLDISDTEDTMDVTFSGDVTAVTLTTTGNLYDVIFQEDVTVTNDVTFAAIRNLDIGGATDDTATFTGGLDTATNVTGTVTIAGTVQTEGAQIDLGAVTLAAATLL